MVEINKQLVSILILSFCIGVYSQNQNFQIQNVAARDVVSLDGKWQFIVDPIDSGLSGSTRYGFYHNSKLENSFDYQEYQFISANSLHVPGDWNSQQKKLFFYEGTVWYRNLFMAKKNQEKRYFLHFDAVNYIAKVYLNGKEVGMHEGGFTPFSFEVTEFLKDGVNEVVVYANNERKQEYVPNLETDWWNYGGITRSVQLLETEKVFVRDYTIKLHDKRKDEIEVQLSLSDSVSSMVTLIIPELKIKKEIKTNGAGKGFVTFKGKPVLWSPENPKLYEVRLQYGEESIRDKIGFRTIETQGTKILLNGKPIFLKGISIHEEAPFEGKRVGTYDEAKQLLTWAQEMNCNYVRLAHYPHNGDMLKLADAMGILVWSEIPVYWKIDWNSEHAYTTAENQLTEMIERDKNRASVIIWSVANETPDTEERTVFLKNLIDRTRALDYTRLLSAALHQVDYDENSNTKTITDGLVEFIDVMSVNNYCGWYENPIDGDCGQLKWASAFNKPLILSEFGGGALQGHHGEERWTEEFQSNIYKQNFEMMDNIDFLAGMSPWILKDFRSPRRFLPGIQEFWNRKGLISERGIKKEAFFIMKDYYKGK